MLHLGDITKISGYTAPIVDCVVGGSPFQDLSTAGKRAGLDGERSGLFMDQIRIVKEMRKRDERENGRAGVDVRPRHMVWENVCGTMSSGTPKGEDFRIVLEEIARVKDQTAVIPRPDKWQTSGCIVGDGWSIAWRVLDAQFYGTPSKPLPQRRRRIALVADFGGQSAPEILFVRKSLSGDIEPGKPTWKGTADDAKRCTGIYDSLGADQYNAVILGDTVSALGINCGMSHGRQCVLEPTVFIKSRRAQSVADYETWKEGNTANTLNTFENTDVRATNVVVATNADAMCYAVDQGGGKSACNVFEESTPTLTCTHGGEPVVCYPDRIGHGPRIVRRLTPLECERLQGYHDGWTDIGEWTDSKGKTRQTSDSARYKALGNSIAIPPWKWVMKRLCACYERDATLASLFDGISGFPFIWTQLNGWGSVLWSSENDEFPMAVCKKHFGDETTGEQGDLYQYLQK